MLGRSGKQIIQDENEIKVTESRNLNCSSVICPHRHVAGTCRQSNIFFFLPQTGSKALQRWAWSAKWEALGYLRHPQDLQESRVSPVQQLVARRSTQSPGCLHVGNWVKHILMSPLPRMQTPKFRCLILKVSPTWCFTLHELLIFQLQIFLEKNVVFVFPSLSLRKKNTTSKWKFWIFLETCSICVGFVKHFPYLYRIYFKHDMPFVYPNVAWPTQTFGKTEDGWKWGVRVSSLCLCCCSICRQHFGLSLLVHIYVFDPEQVSKLLCASVPWLSDSSIPTCLHWKPVFLLNFIFFWTRNFLSFPMRLFYYYSGKRDKETGSTKLSKMRIHYRIDGFSSLLANPVSVESTIWFSVFWS